VKSFWKNPFEQELPLLLFPEKKAWLSYSFDQQDGGCLLDDRPLCLQTPFNFLELTPLLLPQTSELLTHFKTEIIKETSNLGANEWQFKTEEPKSEKKLLWPCRRIKPITPQLRFSVEKNQQEIYSFKAPCIGNSPGKNTFYSISDKTGWISFIYKEKAWPLVKTFVQQTNIPLGINKIRQD
jgi:hypothetical protein